MEAPLRHIHSTILPCVLAEKVAEMIEKQAQPIIQSQISSNLNCDIFNKKNSVTLIFQSISIIKAQNLTVGT